MLRKPDKNQTLQAQLACLVLKIMTGQLEED